MISKKLKIIVLAKQVPDTRNVGKDAMREDGTVNRSGLPAIFNPDDLNALEQALRIKDQYPESTVTVLTMGPTRAVEIIKEGLYRGADDGYLLTDRAFAGSDTLATSYALSCAVRKIGDYDLIIAGSQAIDGDTAQVGPQVAEKLHIPQVTYIEEIMDVTDKYVVVKRRIENGYEIVKSTLPSLLTVHSSAAPCRYRSAKLVMKYKHARSEMERKADPSKYDFLSAEHDYLNIKTWSVEDVSADVSQLGLSGSPTKVKSIENVVFKVKESKTLTDDDAEIESVVKELIANHTIG